MKKFLIFFLSLVWTVLPAQTDSHDLPKPSPVQMMWQDMELTMFIHFGPATWQDQEYDDLSTPLDQINPSNLDTDQWVEVAESYGAKMIIFCAKHTGGFAWWQTETTDYGVKETPWKGGKGDVMKDLAVSCKKKGIRLGVYLSPEDRYLGVGMGGKTYDSSKQAEYERIYRRQLIELLTGYGDIYELWVDGSLIFDISDIVYKYAKKAVILQSSAATIRWVGNEMGFAPYPAWNGIMDADARSGNATAAHSNPNGNVWMPIEVDVSIRRPTWFWKTWSEKNLLSIEELMKIYYCSVGRGTVFLINACPDTTGQISQAEAKRFAEFGKEIKDRFGNPLMEVKGKGYEHKLEFDAPQKVDNIILMEDISRGERVRAFHVEGKTHDGWEHIFKGSAIGHKLIQQIPANKYEIIKLVVDKSVGKPYIRKMAAFYTGKPYIELPVVKENWNLRNVGIWSIDSDSAASKDIILDLTEFCQSAETYEIALVVRGDGDKDAVFSYDWANTGEWEDNIPSEKRLVISNVSLYFAGVEANQYLYPTGEKRNRVKFNLTGIPSELLVKLNVVIPANHNGAKIEAYLMRK